MKYIILFLSITFNAVALIQSELKAGDVLLISLNCYECRMIESETNSTFSHSGVVLFDENNNLKVAQSIGRIALFDLNTFLKNITKGSNISIYRSHNLENGNVTHEKMLKLYKEKYEGIAFDRNYLWNNFDQNKKELLYCSEFIAKFLDNFLDEKTIPRPMTYKKHFDYWFNYFKGNVPEGELGNSPAEFSRDHRFYFVGNLEI
jgi:hypothetical protein